MKIATWNVNSIKARLPNILEWLEQAQPDVVLLQETKTVDDGFPAMEIEDLGYNIAIHGQKTYNGVAILSKFPIEDVQRGLPGNDDDEQARYIEAVISGQNPVRVASIYVPMGTEVGSEKFAYKLNFLDRLITRFEGVFASGEAAVMGGDYNITPDDSDVYDPEKLHEKVLCSTQERKRLRTMMNLGYTDAFRTFNANGHQYSWWDYRAGAWNKDNGLRIDHLLLTPAAADRLSAADIDRDPRGKEKASDHTPVWCMIDG
ncbi:exodeoxyribonuclease III [Thalassospira mesophila]|uniref:Exodeoxyribonuclease III n=1 Tax=Thalassospira mesophila TaxID=1293891 RepID=A0A1Y2KYL9_9PROT|nr:exodeoxyribonuclease III [Thalassospira mesophila]OSQ37777.1 exodeoxyribonuclease III [Thalassospira mesophila]